MNTNQEKGSQSDDIDMFTEMRAAGSSIPDMVEFLQANGWQTYQHHDNWVKTEWLQDPNFSNPVLFDLHQAYNACQNEVNPSFEYELQHLINRFSIENGSNTPDFILAKYLQNCLEAYNTALQARDKHFNYNPWAKLHSEIKPKTVSSSLDGCPFNYCDSRPHCEGHCRYHKPA